jgi:hypothetical protein
MCSTPWSNAVVFQDRFDKVLDQDNKLQKDKHKGLIYKCGMAGPTVPNKNNNKEAAAQLHLPTKSQSHYPISADNGTWEDRELVKIEPEKWHPNFRPLTF